MSKFFIFIMLAIMLVACHKGSDLPGKEASSNQTVEALYHQAMNELKERKYKTAITHFEQIERDHPYSKWAIKAQEMAAYANYNDEKYDEVIAIADRFIKLHPGHQDISYMYYLRAM
ncbi:MAG: outer membrane protein assembly factor BamD, partial [Burkholderiales bacterium]